MRKENKRSATVHKSSQPIKDDPRMYLCPCSATYWQYLAEEGNKCLRDN